MAALATAGPALLRRTRRIKATQPRHAQSLGAVGPAARASGIADDVRSTSERLAYEGFDVQVPDFPLIDKSFELCCACADR
jgi:Ni,Fe-hydrogenase III large subunit